MDEASGLFRHERNQLADAYSGLHRSVAVVPEGAVLALQISQKTYVGDAAVPSELLSDAIVESRDHVAFQVPPDVSLFTQTPRHINCNFLQQFGGVRRITEHTRDIPV